MTDVMRYEDRHRREYLYMVKRVHSAWLELFKGNPELYSAHYSDLFLELWLAERPIRKTDALSSMRGLKSPVSASKLLEHAITAGLVQEIDNPTDARSKLVFLDPDMRNRLSGFLDQSLTELRRAIDKVDQLAK
jgi:hypothetical protein